MTETQICNAMHRLGQRQFAIVFRFALGSILVGVHSTAGAMGPSEGGPIAGPTTGRIMASTTDLPFAQAWPN